MCLCVGHGHREFPAAERQARRNDELLVGAVGDDVGELAALELVELPLQPVGPAFMPRLSRRSDPAVAPAAERLRNPEAALQVGGA